MKYFIFFFLFVLSQPVFGQEINFNLGKEFRDYNVSPYDYVYPLSFLQPLVIGQSSEFVFTFHIDMIEKTMKISKLDTALNMVLSKDLILPIAGNNTRYYSCVTFNGILHHFVSQEDTTTHKRNLYEIRMDENLDAIDEPLKIGSVDFLNNEKFGISVSDDKSKICFYTKPATSWHDTVRAEYRVYSLATDEPMWNKFIDYKKRHSNFKLLYARVDNDGNVYIIARQKIARSERKSRKDSKWMINIIPLSAYGMTTKNINLLAQSGSEFCNIGINTQDKENTLVFATFQKTGTRKRKRAQFSMNGKDGILTRVISKKSFTTLSAKDYFDYALTKQNKLKERFIIEDIEKLKDGWAILLQARTDHVQIGDYYKWLRIDATGMPIDSKVIPLNMKRKTYYNTAVMMNDKFTSFVVQDDIRNKGMEVKDILRRSASFNKNRFWNRYLRVIVLDHATGKLVHKNVHTINSNSRNFISFGLSMRLDKNSIVLPFINRLLKVTVD